MVCETCTCTGRAPHGPDCSQPESRLLLSTPFAHLSGAVDETAHDLDLTVRSLAGGLWELRGDRLDEAVSALRREMSLAEAQQSRVLIGIDSGDDAAVVVAAMSAPTLDQLDAQLHGAKLSQLFDHEHATFRSMYQPIVTLDSREVVAFEALLRARTPDGEELTPGPLFEHAQRAGWSARLDRIGRTSALHGAAGWLTDRSLFINFIPTSIYDPKVCLVTTERAAERAGIALEQIVFEVTESERVADVDHLQRVFEYYRARGCRVALGGREGPGGGHGRSEAGLGRAVESIDGSDGRIGGRRGAHGGSCSQRADGTRRSQPCDRRDSTGDLADNQGFDRKKCGHAGVPRLPPLPDADGPQPDLSQRAGPAARRAATRRSAVIDVAVRSPS